jgi:Uma2 family endonuclease
MMTPAGFEHSQIAVAIAALLRNYVQPRGLGQVVGADAGFQIRRDPDTVRSPDVAFVRAERLAADPPRGFFSGAPDLAVEVLSPTDRANEVQAKVHDWLEAGCYAVWVVDPPRRTVTVYGAASEAAVFHEADTLIAGDILPGLSFPVAAIFAS